MPIIIHQFAQHSPEWHAIRLGKITASILSTVITPAKLQLSASSDETAYRIAAERILGFADDDGVNTFDMQRGTDLESEAFFQYSQHHTPVESVGFAENTDLAFPFGASPDGLIDGRKGAIEIKCPRAKHHLRHLDTGDIDGKYILQMQGTMLAAGLEYVDFISFCEGLKMKPVRVFRDDDVIGKIIAVGETLEQKIQAIIHKYNRIGGIEIPAPEEAE